MTLVPFGGFGDPDVSDVVWKPPRNFDPDKLELAKAQNRLARALRVRIQEMDISEGELESLLGYKRGYLVRKLNGVEALTMRDVVRISRAFGASIISYMAHDNPQFPSTKGSRIAGTRAKR